MKKLIYLLGLLVSMNVFAQHNPEITAGDLKKDVTYLASDSLKGRKPGTPEAGLAAGFIRKEFVADHLKLLFEKGYQNFEIVTSASLGAHNALKFNGFEGAVGRNFTPVVYSSNASVSAYVVFAGYGFDIKTDSVKWNDYEHIDAGGKWVMIFRADPELDNSDSKFIPYSELRGKILTAKDHGAAGVLVVSPVALDKEDKLMVLRTENNDVTSGIPVIHIQRSVADLLLKPSGYRVDSLEKIFHDTKAPKSFDIPNANAYGVTDVVLKRDSTANVAGVLEGKDPVLKNEYIVIGGHYDHLGFGGPGSGSRMPDTVAIHNGADDNASGTAMVMELAGKIASARNNLKRSVIFVSFTGEEMGLLGSKYFTDHPPVDLKKIKAMFNFDMVGRFDKEKNAISVSGTGTSAEGDSILKKYETGLPFAVTHSPDGYGPSDHASFYANNIPVFFFTTGVHTDYHTPFDNADKLDYDAEKKIGDFSYKLIMDIDRMAHPLTFKESGKKESAGRSGRRYKVTLGIMPDFAGTEKKGLRVDGVTKDGPADKGGMLKGDVIISINGMTVGNIYEYMARLGKLAKGQTISVEVIRNDKNVVLLIQL